MPDPRDYMAGGPYPPYGSNMEGGYAAAGAGAGLAGAGAYAASHSRDDDHDNYENDPYPAAAAPYHAQPSAVKLRLSVSVTGSRLSIPSPEVLDHTRRAMRVTEQVLGLARGGLVR
jgi:hypothetical protein